MLSSLLVSAVDCCILYNNFVCFFLVEQFRVLVLQQFRAIVHFLVSVRLKGGKRPKPHLTASLTQLCILIKKSTTVHP